jgi:p-hydroxybenzoate 3-monooxygenase
VIVERAAASTSKSACARASSNTASPTSFEESGLGTRLRAEGLVHHGVEIRFERTSHRIALSELYVGHAITVYGQQEVVKDLVRAAPRERRAPVLRHRGHVLVDLTD